MAQLRGYLTDHYFGLTAVLRFLPKYYRYMRSLSPAGVSAQAAPHLTALRRDGIVIIPNFLPAAMIAAMRDAVPAIEAFEVSPEGDKANMITNAERFVEFAPFFESELVRELARGYISDRAVPHRRTIGLKTVLGDFMTFEQHYHMDTWRQRVKAFLYLGDIGPQQAPMMYLRGSHRGRWRRWVEAQIERDYTVDDRGFGGDTDIWYLGCFWPHEVAQLKTDYGYTDISCTGSAGTLVMFDGRGLHRATPLLSGRRLILTSYWIHEDAHV